MTFVVLNCTRCGHRVLVDEIDGSGFCMYCGGEIMPSGDPSESLDDYSISFLEALTAPVENPSFENEPWYPEVEDIVSSMKEADFDRVSRDLPKALDGKDARTRRAIQDAMVNELVMAVMEPVFNGFPYCGGVMDVAPLLVDPEDDDTEPSVLIASLYSALCDSKGCMEGAERAYCMAVSLYELVSDYVMAEPSVSDVSSILEDLQEQIMELIIIASVDGDQHPAVVSMQNMCRATETLYGAINEGIEGSDEGRLGSVESAWADGDVATIGAGLREVMVGVMEDDLDGYWDRLSEACKAYVREYFGVGL